jgi:hypothetical protein
MQPVASLSIRTAAKGHFPLYPGLIGIVTKHKILGCRIDMQLLGWLCQVLYPYRSGVERKLLTSMTGKSSRATPWILPLQLSSI